ncbi:MAG: Gfo/Idh/MocA family oxidoreductase [Armatimonadota bacterium]|nr:Gfo/Idh/MocA family oxidoreductase [Armatimonadota bacterium]MCX7777003.1 Gfo/Idh/MocA family oxidoreductase [Armatimonadota bacterium]MDW8024929.1 Gfo/Idh/MocA family oxidoreductase [Armatimonadota bacterium]
MAVRVGFIGSGGIARLHMQNLSRIEDVELVAFCDTAVERAKECANQYGGRAYDSHAHMFEREELDAVYICIPPGAHTDQEVMAAQANVHIFAEKPIALSLDVAHRALDAIKSAGVINSVGYHFRYLDTTDIVKERLSGQTVGMVLGYWMGGLPGTPWWRRMEQSGGQIVEQTTHIFDLARYTVGEITHVCAAASLRALHDVPNLDVPDVGAVLIWFENGAIGCISNTCMLRRGYRVGLDIFCRDMVIEHSSGSVRFIYPQRVEEISAARNGHAYESEIFIKAVRERDQSLIRCDYEDAVRTLAVTLAANESIQKGERVEVARL